jgi:MFS family permease
MFFVREMIGVMIAGSVMMSGFMLSFAAITATIRDHTPADRAGTVQGLRMIFAIMVPMILGPIIGAAVIVGAGETYVDLGVEKQVPTAWIFLAAAAVLVFTIPLVRIVRRSERRAIQQQEQPAVVDR